MANSATTLTRPTVARRMGPVGSPTWLAMLGAAEATLLEEGYGALTSRRVAERIGVKQRLVYYYFQTMDELIVETFRRLSQRELERIRLTLQSDAPVRELWDVCIHTTDSRLTSEFMALAHRNDGLKGEVIAFIKESRHYLAQTIRLALERSGTNAAIDAEGLALFATGAALAMTREAGLGVSVGHSSLKDFINLFIEQVEPGS